MLHKRSLDRRQDMDPHMENSRSRARPRGGSEHNPTPQKLQLQFASRGLRQGTYEWLVLNVRHYV